MSCWHCSRRLAEGVRICAFCGADQRTPGQKPKAAKSLAEQERAVPASRRRMSMGGRGAPRWPWLVLLGVVVATAGAIWALRPETVELDALALADTDAGRPCASEPRCLVVYVGPWAPTTERAVATARRLAVEEAGQLGVAIVVGADDPEIMDEFARSLGLPAFLDPDDGLVRALAIETSPTFFVTNPAGTVERRVEGVFFPYDYHREKLGL